MRDRRGGRKRSGSEQEGNKLKKQRVVQGLAGIRSRRKRKKRGWWKGRRGIVFRAVVFLSVPLFKGTLALMTLPYSALGVRAGAQRCTLPAGLELLLTARTKPSRQAPGEPADTMVMSCDTAGFQNLQPQRVVMSSEQLPASGA